MFQVKICGITNVDDALAASEAGADAIGLNFYQRSKRFVDIEAAKAIGRALPPSVKKVAVFVNADARAISAVTAQVDIDGVQLHGDEEPDLIAQLPRQVAVIRAFRCGEQGLAPLLRFLALCRSLGRQPDAVLIDADAGDEFGGTGRVADWSRVANERELILDLPLILGGGLTPENVADAIAIVRPDGVDVATGVERSPGRKDSELVERFIAAARRAFTRPR